MIDAREEVVVTAPHPSRRRPSPVAATRSTKPAASARKSVRVERVFSDAKVKPFDQIEWDRRTAEITDDAGKVVFKQENVEVPKSWSVLATKVVVSKYFYGEQHTSERETSVRQLIHRITRTMADWGVKDGYFSKADGEVFYDELTWLCVNQFGAFNSPVWFNVGLYPQYGIGKNSSKGNWYYNRNPGRSRARGDPIRISAGQCVLHPVRAGQHGRHHASGIQRGDALQIRLGHGHGSFAHPQQPRETQRWRSSERPDEFPEGL